MDDSHAPPDADAAGRDDRGRSSHASEKRDRQLLAAVAGGDEEAFVKLYQGHATAVFNYLRRLIHDEALAEDLLQETFVAVWQGASTFRRRARVKTWILRIAHNRAVSWLRRNRPLSLEETEVVSAAEDEGPEMSFMANWRAAQVATALEALSPNHRAVLELVFVQELPYADIGQIMSCPVGTVKSRVSYALRHLNRLLIQAGIEESAT